MFLRRNFLGWILLVAVGVFPITANAAKYDSLRNRLASAAGDFNSTMQGIDRTLEKLPEKVSTSKWTSIKSGALEIKKKAEALSATLRQIDTTLGDLRIGEGRLAKRLDEMVREFESLTNEAESDAAKLPEPLANVAKRERDTWRRGAVITQAFKDHYQSLLADFDEQVKSLKLVQPILARIMMGSDLYVELATVGEDLETGVATLQTLVDQLNAILDMFDALAGHTEDAIAKANPMTSPIFNAASQEVPSVNAAVPSSDGSSRSHAVQKSSFHSRPAVDSIANVASDFPTFKAASQEATGVNSAVPSSDGSSRSHAVEKSLFRPRPAVGSITHVGSDSSRVAFTGIEANVGDRLLVHRKHDCIGQVIVQEHRDGQVIATWNGDVTPQPGDSVRRSLIYPTSLRLVSR